MTQYPLDHGPSADDTKKRDHKVQAEAEAALRSSFEIHGKSSLNAANEDLTLNPVRGSSRTRPLTPDLYAGAGFTDEEPLDDDDLFEDRSRSRSRSGNKSKSKSSAIDDVVSSGTWQTSSYLGPKRTALDDLTGETGTEHLPIRKPLRNGIGRALTGRSGRRRQLESVAGPIAMVIGAAGAGYLLARLIANHRSS